MSNMFGTPQDHEQSVQKRMAARDGAQTEETADALPKIEKPMVIQPDGTLVDPTEYDPYKAERDQLADREAYVAQEETRVQNLRDVTVAGLGKEGGETTTEEETGLKIPRIELPGDDEYVDDTQRAIVEGVNNLAEAIENQSNQTQEDIKKVVETLGDVGQTANSLSLERQLESVEARYGVDRQDLFKLSRETQIRDPETLANIALGQQAQAQREKEAQEQAEQQRLADARGITGASHGSPGSDTPTRREEVDYNDSEALARVYKVKPSITSY